MAVGGTHPFLFLKVVAHSFNGTLSPGMLDICATCILPKESCLLVTCLIVVTRTPGDSHLKMGGVAPSLGKVWRQLPKELVLRAESNVCIHLPLSLVPGRPQPWGHAAHVEGGSPLS